MRPTTSCLLLALAVARVAAAEPPMKTVTMEPSALELELELLEWTSEEPVGLRVTQSSYASRQLGLADGDVIRSINGQLARHPYSFERLSRVYLEVVRGKQMFVVRVELRRAGVVEVQQRLGTLAFSIEELRGSADHVAGVATRNGKPTGVLIEREWPWLFVPGDIVRTVDKTRITTPAELLAAFDAAKNKAPAKLVFEIERHDRPITIELAIEDELVPPPQAPSSDDEVPAEVAGAIKQLDATHYEVNRAVVEAVTTTKGARVVPSLTNGQADGFKLYAIRPSSIFARLGLHNGDTIKKVNHRALAAADQALEIYARERAAKLFVVEIVRRGLPLTLSYTVK
ncbi:MAG TPA: hypothetical protein VF469_14295 [Kofleriaceae bacterium]